MLKYICDRCGAVMEKTDGAMRLAVYKSLTYKADNEEQPKRLLPRVSGIAVGRRTAGSSACATTKAVGAPSGAVFGIIC